MAAPQKVQSQKSPHSGEDQMPFGKMNYIGMIAGLFLVILGFYLMTGEKFIDADHFSKALYIAPPVIIIGFAVITYAIMINPGKNKGPEPQREFPTMLNPDKKKAIDQEIADMITTGKKSPEKDRPKR